jgi:WD40 repeat protein
VLAISSRLQPDIKLCDVAQQQELATLKGHTVRVNDLAFAPDGKTLVSAGEDGTLRVWAVPPPAPAKP